MSDKLVLNTIVFKDLLDAGWPQVNLLAETKALGVSQMEIRREFLQDVPQDLIAIREKANQLDMALFYSINDDLVIDGKINPRIVTYIDEATVLQAKVLKINTGSVAGLTVAELNRWQSILQVPFQVSVENNQTPGHATIDNIRSFLDLSIEAELNLRFVFDTGNWYWVGETVEKAMEFLKEDTHYLHLKNYSQDGTEVRVASLFEGELDIATVIGCFSDVDYYALEYPCSPSILAHDIKKVLSYLGE